jgi:hypothetical protein
LLTIGGDSWSRRLRPDSGWVSETEYGLGWDRGDATLWALARAHRTVAAAASASEMATNARTLRALVERFRFDEVPA